RGGGLLVREERTWPAGATWPCSKRRTRSGALEVRCNEVQVGEVDGLERAEADTLQLRGERPRVAHEHNRQAIGPEILTRNALNVVHGDHIHALAERLQLF